MFGFDNSADENISYVVVDRLHRWLNTLRCKIETQTFVLT